MDIRTGNSLKILGKYVIIFVCVMLGSIAYATDAGLSRRLIVILSTCLFGMLFLCRKFVNAKWHKYIIFSICYWFIAGALINRAISNERIAVAGSDAVVQMYPVMLYIGRLVREFFESLFTQTQFSFPMWEWSLGMGENTLSTLNYYGLGDPFYLLSALVSEEKLPYFFTFFLYFRMYLGGIFCIVFFHELNQEKSNQAYVIGALAYSFSGFAFYSNVFIIFAHAMMYTPMLLWGAERVLQSKKKGILLTATFLYALSGFFFLYVSSIALGIYVIYRLITQKTEVRKAIYKVLELLAEYLVSLSLVAFVFLPAMLGYFSSSRVGTFSLDFSFISFGEIKELLLNAFLPHFSNGQMMSMCGISILCIIFTLFARKKYLYKLNIILLFLCMIIPAVSTIMSGGGYYDRWELVVILYAAYLTFQMWDDIENLTLVQKLATVGVWLIMIIYGLKEGVLSQQNYGYTILSYGVLLILITIVLPICRKWDKNAVGSIMLFVAAVATVYKSWALTACDWEIFFVRQDDVVHELIEEEEGNFYRIEYEKTFEEPRLGMNISFMLDYPGISQYFSIENGNYVNAFGEWETGEPVYNNQGLDYRTVLETLAGVKYFIAHSDNQLFIPYGFEKVKDSIDGEWTLYENKYALPIAYTYEKVFDSDIYNQDMNGLEKQDVLLQAAAIEDYEGMLPVITEVSEHLSKGEYKIESLKDVVIEDEVVHVKAGSIMKLSTILKANCENYLYFDDNLSVAITIGNEHEKYHEKTTLGIVSEDVEKEITIEFLEDVTFPVERMNIYQFDFAQYKNYIDKLNDGSVTDIEVETNRIHCNVNTNKAKILCISAPYEKGWKAEVDGVETTVYRMNSMYMGIEIPEGDHVIELTYVTPGLRTGIVLSGLAIVIIVFYIVKNKKRR